jgi:hypothetical protein
MRKSQMTTRIQELIIQANFLRKDEKSIEKFAELIVKECVESLWTEECYNSDLALEEFERNSAKIKQHFGVEE